MCRPSKSKSKSTMSYFENCASDMPTDIAVFNQKSMQMLQDFVDGKRTSTAVASDAVTVNFDTDSGLNMVRAQMSRVHAHAPLYQADFPRLTQMVVSVFAVTGVPTTAQMRVLRDCRRALSGAQP